MRFAFHHCFFATRHDQNIVILLCAKAAVMALQNRDTVVERKNQDCDRRDAVLLCARIASVRSTFGVARVPLSPLLPIIVLKYSYRAAIFPSLFYTLCRMIKACA
jgi:hypothetical protein